MEITVSELERLSPDSYILYDTRSEQEKLYGVMEGAVSVSADELLAAPPEDKTQKLIICCARGKFSVDTAEQLSEMGYDAYSLSGGYAAWLLAVMQKEQADEVSKRVEQSLQKKFRKKIWAAFTKAVKQYELVKENDRIAVCISGGKDSMLMAKLFQELQRFSVRGEIYRNGPRLQHGKQECYRGERTQAENTDRDIRVGHFRFCL